MALDLRISLQRESSRNDPVSENLELEPTQRPGVQKEEEISEFQSTQLNSFQSAKQELQRLHKFFHSWLQPEKHTKDEIISQLVLEQFMLNGHSRNRSSLKEKWDSSGRNLEKFMEDLTDDCMNPPGFVHVHMQAQEAIFCENMSLREVITYLTGQSLAGTPTGQSMGTPCHDAQDSPLQTGPGDENKEDGSSMSVKTTQVNDRITSRGSQVPSSVIIQEENIPKSEEGAISQENPHNSSKAGLDSSRSQEESLGGPSHQDVPMEVEPPFLPRPDQATPEPVPPQATHDPIPTDQCNEGKPRCGVNQERENGRPKSYRCEDCPRIFRYFSQLEAHQRRHRNERPFVCAECHKGFFQTSDLHVHQKIHAAQKPFGCSTCEKSFSHKTNLRAHERIHTGEKPYTCSLCQRSYRQSSTYHRHVRTHQRTPLRGRAAPQGASPAAVPT